MMLAFKTPELEAVARDLGLTQATLQQCLNAPSLEEAKARFEILKKAVKARYRQLSLELHPDRNPEGGETFKTLSMVYAEVEKFFNNVQISTRPPVPPPVQWMHPVVIHVGHFGCSFYGGGTSTSTTSATTTYFGSNWWSR